MRTKLGDAKRIKHAQRLLPSTLRPGCPQGTGPPRLDISNMSLSPPQAATGQAHPTQPKKGPGDRAWETADAAPRGWGVTSGGDSSSSTCYSSTSGAGIHAFAPRLKKLCICR